MPEDLKALMPRYWTINDSLRFYCSKMYKIEPTLKKMKQYLLWLKSIQDNGYYLTKSAAELLVSCKKV